MESNNTYNKFVQASETYENEDKMLQYEKGLKQLNNILNSYIEIIRNQMNSTFHLGTFKKQNNSFIGFLTQFSSDLSNGSFNKSQYYLYQVMLLFDELCDEYKNACNRKFVPGSKLLYFNYNKANLNTLLNTIQELYNKMKKTFRKMFADQFGELMAMG